MSAVIDNEYDSDAEYVPDFDMVNLNDFRLTKGEELAGGSWEFNVEHCHDDDISLQFAMPQFTVGDQVDIQDTSKNGFYRVKLDPSNSKHLNFQNWIMKVETWLVSQLVNNYNVWFGYLYEQGAPFEGRKPPPPEVIKNMYHPMIDEEGIFCSRVHIRKGKYEIQMMDKDQNKLTLDDVKMCEVVPLVELKGVFMKPRGYNPDVVLRGLVRIDAESSEEDITNTEYKLFHTDENEKDYRYFDYATADENTESEAEFTDDDDDDEEEESEDDEDENKNDEENDEEYDEETIRKLLERQEIAKKQALDAEAEYNRYIGRSV